VCSDDIKAKLSACFESAGAIALADAIRDMRALSSLNLADNRIGGYYDREEEMTVATPEGTRPVIFEFPLHLLYLQPLLLSLMPSGIWGH
jgi:hypothetical protein